MKLSRALAARTLAATAMLAALVVQAPTAHAAFPGSNGKIAYQRDGHIWVANPDGTSQTDISGAVPIGSDDHPAFSPDGSRLAFWSRRGGDQAIWVMNADGTGARRVTTPGAGENDADPAWFPDGTRIAFQRNTDGLANSEIFAVNADGSGLTRITNTPDIDETEPTVSPDGTKIATNDFRFAADGGAGIYVINADGTGATNVSSGISAGTFCCPNWSPDGIELAVIASTVVWMVGADGSNPRKVTTQVQARPFGISFSPDGTQLAFRDANEDIRVVGVDGSGEQALISSPADERFPDWGVGLNEIRGTDEGETIEGTEGPDVIFAGAGNDTIRSLDGNDVVYGEDGDDVIDGGPGINTLYGGIGNDVMRNVNCCEGDPDNCCRGRAFGEDGDDSISGGPADNFIRGGAGRDVIAGGGGQDHVFGDGGADQIRLETHPNEDPTPPAMAEVDGGGGGDEITGNFFANIIEGGSGQDVIDGAGGGDEIRGGLGDDTIFVCEGEPCGEEGGKVFGEAGNDVITHCEEPPCGGEEGFVADGGTGDDIITGGVGADKLTGGDGVDELAGGNHTDHVIGGSGNDILRGEGGFNDVLEGGAGNDRIDDTLVFSPIGECDSCGKCGGCCCRGLVSGGGGADKITITAPGRGSAPRSPVKPCPQRKSNAARQEARVKAGGGNDVIRARDGVREIIDGGAGKDRARVDKRDDVKAVEKFI